jgi:hypothetical protein
VAQAEDEAMRESEILSKIRDACSRGAVRLWRNNVGKGVMIQHKHAQTRQAIISECIELAKRRGGSGARITYGLQVGSGDLIGLRVVEITPEMVGRKVAVFASCEVKTDTGRESPEQVAWREFIASVGGVAMVARSVEEARAELDKAFTGA